jgi:exonuclease III
MPKVLRFFDRQQADVLCLQEVRSSPDAVIEGFRQSRTDSEEIQFPACHYYAPTYDFEMMGKTIYFGNCILSRHPMNTKRNGFCRFAL